jgi:hypothetical protein
MGMHYFWKLDPDLHLSKKFRSFTAVQALIEPRRAVDAQNRGLKAQTGAIHEGSIDQ